MVEKNKKYVTGFYVLLIFVLHMAVLAWFLVKKDKSVSNQTVTAVHNDGRQVDSTGEPASLKTIVRHARTWAPMLHGWYGKKAPELVFNDLNGNVHKLSEYSGKDILLLFWGTWCPPCISEIPGLMELRRTQSTDELAMIAVSTEDPQKVKSFAQQRKINYDVATAQNQMNSPYELITSLPSAFYIDKQGNFKLITEGAVSMAETLAIIKAKK